MRKPKQEFSKKPKEFEKLNNTQEIISEDIHVKEKKLSKEEESEQEFFSKYVSGYSSNRITFAKVNWGVGKGPYILAFDSECDATYCECNAHEFKYLKENDIKQNNVHIWECGSKLPEEINKLPTLDMKKYIEDSKTERQKRLEEKQKKKEEKAKAKEECQQESE
jgi:hypothetical protein